MLALVVPQVAEHLSSVHMKCAKVVTNTATPLVTNRQRLQHPSFLNLFQDSTLPHRTTPSTSQPELWGHTNAEIPRRSPPHERDCKKRMPCHMLQTHPTTVTWTHFTRESSERDAALFTMHKTTHCTGGLDY